MIMPPRKRARKVSNEADTVKLETELEQLTCEQLRQELLDIGENPGPIDLATKPMYVRQLARKKIKLETSSSIDTSSSLASSSSSSSPSATSSLVLTASSGSGGGGRGSLTSSPATTKRSPARKDVGGGRGGPVLTHTPVGSALRLAKEKATPLKAGGGGRAVASKATGRQAASKSQADIFKFEVKGLLAASFTPMTDTGELNLPVIKPYVNFLKISGINNVFLNGTTGESLNLTTEERKLLAEEWIKQAKGKMMTVIVHVGCNNLKETCELASHAQEIGADAIGVMPPVFFKPATVDNLVLYLSKVGEAAPSMPMYYYHIPDMTAVKLSMEELLDAASTRLPTLRGLKYTDYNLMELGRCLSGNGGKYQVLYGRDEQLIGSLAIGCNSAVGSTYNYAGHLNNRLVSAFEKGDIEAARLEQRRSQAHIKLLHKYSAIAGGSGGVGKAMLKMRSKVVDCGPPRLPMLALSEETYKSLESDLRDIGFFEWA